MRILITNDDGFDAAGIKSLKKIALAMSTEDNVFVPRNVLLAFTEDFAALKDTVDSPETPSAKIKRNVLVQHGRDWEDGAGYKNTKSSLSFPFNIISSSVDSGFYKQVDEGVSACVEITTLHNDVYGPDMERPMQGPFTNHVVGGHQSRHVKLNTGTDSYLNRPEAWKILSLIHSSEPTRLLTIA